MKLLRPDPISFERHDGRCYLVQPATRAQVKACLKLDRDDDETETPEELDARIAAQLRALVGTHLREVDPQTYEYLEGATPLPIEQLTAMEERQILTALINQHHGNDPTAAVAIANAVKKNFVALAGVLDGSKDSIAIP